MARRRRQSRRRSTGNWMLPVGGLLILATLTTWGVSRVRANRAAEASSTPVASKPAERNPFGDLPPTDAGPNPFGEGGAQTAVDDAVWVAAEQLAARGEKLYQGAVDAKQAEDRARMVEQGRASIELFRQAIEDSEPFEDDLIARLGAKHTETRAVVRARQLWFQRVVWLHKSAMR